MSNNLIDLGALSEYKTQCDLKYQDKLTAGNSVSLNNNVMSVAPNYVEVSLDSYSVASATLTELERITLAPGSYVLVYTCQFDSNSTGYRQCGFSTNTTDIDGFDTAFCDSRKAANGVITQTRVSAIFQVSASDYPNGRTFYFLAYQNSGSSRTAYPRCIYFKF